jgi:flagellar hook-associated protein 2
MNEINANEKAGVNLAYSSITGKLTLQTKKTGASASLNAQDADDGSNFFLSTFGLNNVNLEADATRDATVQLKIDGQSYTMTSPTNTFTRDGITFNLMANTVGKEIDIDVSRDVDSAFNNIKNFVEKYNGMIDKLNNKLVEKRYRDYKPLTDEQKKSMEESDIKLWEEKSKSGVLRSDPIVQNITQSMRRALIEKIEGVNISLSDIGITTGQWYENGKLYVNEEKLKDALANRGEEVEKLFCQQYKESYSPDLNAEERKVRYNNVGIMHRFSDIIQDNIRTRRDKNNKKGILLEKAGIQGDLTDTNNILGDKIKDIDKRIESLNELLYRKEEQYWRQFTAMEKALQSMSSQSMWLMQQLGLGQ